MTDAHLELVKVVLDKGLLAVVLVLFGFLFARRLEQLRAASAYFNKLAERRIEAYDKILRGLSETAHSLREILFLAEHGRSQLQRSGSYDLERIGQDVHKQFLKMQEQLEEQQTGWGPDMVYVSQEFASEVNKLLDEHIAFLDNFFGRADDGKSEDRLVAMKKTFDGLTKALTRVNAQAADQIARGIVAERWKGGKDAL